jgi:hypothetical protein
MNEIIYYFAVICLTGAYWFWQRECHEDRSN